MTIEETITQLNAWCETHQAKTFDGVIYNQPTMVDLGDMDPGPFLEFAQHEGAKSLILTRFPFSLAHEFDQDPEELQSFPAKWKLYQKYHEYEGIDYVLLLNFIKGGVVFQFRQVEAWYDAFHEELENLEEEEELEKEESVSIKRDNTRKVIEAMASHPNYLRYRTRPAKLTALRNQVMKDLNIQDGEFDLWRIKSAVDELFLTEYEAQAVENLSNEIALLKERGNSKAKIRHRLDITGGLLDMLY